MKLLLGERGQKKCVYCYIFVTYVVYNSIKLLAHGNHLHVHIIYDNIIICTTVLINDDKSLLEIAHNGAK